MASFVCLHVLISIWIFSPAFKLRSKALKLRSESPCRRSCTCIDYFVQLLDVFTDSEVPERQRLHRFRHIRHNLSLVLQFLSHALQPFPNIPPPPTLSTQLASVLFVSQRASFCMDWPSCSSNKKAISTARKWQHPLPLLYILLWRRSRVGAYGLGCGIEARGIYLGDEE